MISLTCTNCRTTMSIDDAFAGGVCRCQKCGTIQTVPSHLKRRANAPAAPGPVNDPSRVQKALYQHGQESNTGTKLDELADVVASSGLGSGLTGSGLTGSGLRSKQLRKSPRRAGSETDAPPPRRSLEWILAAGGLLVVLIIAGIWLAMRHSSARPLAASQTNDAPANQTAALPSSEPNFCNIKLDGSIVIYCLDRGNGTSDYFDALKEATCRSIETLGTDRKFQVIFWNNGSDDSFPQGLPAYATKGNIAACRRALEDLTAFGQSDPHKALAKAFANRADLIVLATGKGLDLDSSLIQDVLRLRGDGASSQVKIDAVALGDSTSDVLKSIAESSGGTYKTISQQTLRAAIE